MRDHYDFTDSFPNPFAEQLNKQAKTQVTIRLEEETIAHFKAMAVATGVPYQTLINLYLRDCTRNNRKLEMTWK